MFVLAGEGGLARRLPVLSYRPQQAFGKPSLRLGGEGSLPSLGECKVVGRSRCRNRKGLGLV